MVVARDAIAIRQRRGDGAVPLEGADAEVDRVVRVHHEDVGRILGGQAIYRRELREAGKDGGAVPGDVIESPIYRRECDGPRNLYIYLPGPAVVRDRRARRRRSRLG